MAPPTPSEIQYMQEHPHDSRGSRIIAANVACFLIAFVAVGLRFFARYVAKASLGLDDWLVVIALALLIGEVVSSSVGTIYGLGKDVIFVSNPAALSKSVIAAECFYTVTLPVAKFSVLCLYDRIFPQRWFRRISVGTGLFTIAYSTTQFFGVIFQCVPIQKFWDASLSGRCIDFATFLYATAAVNIVTDLVILILPIPLVWNLQIPRNKRLGLSVVFLIGGCTIVASILRVVEAKALSSWDSTYDEFASVVLTAVEGAGAIVSACMPTYMALVKRVFYRPPKTASKSWPPRGEITKETHIVLSSMPASGTDGWTSIPEYSSCAVGDGFLLHPHENL